MTEGKSKVCDGGKTLIFSCSGAADVGHISDLAARKMMTEKMGQMFCLAGVGGRVEPIMKKTLGAQRILAIDGCHLDCVKKTLREAGIGNAIHVRVTDLGMEKGQRPASKGNVATVVAKGKELLD